MGLNDLLALLGGTNPLGGITKSIGQFQRGVTQFLDSVEKFNDTMDQLNQVAARVNRLLDTVEEPVQAFVPQMTRTIRTADALMEQLGSLPTDVIAFTETLTDLARRLQPLGQLAESAGTMFGLRPLAVLRGGGTRPSRNEPEAAPAPKPAAKKPAAKKAAATKAPAKKAPAAKKAAPKKK